MFETRRHQTTHARQTATDRIVAVVELIDVVVVDDGDDGRESDRGAVAVACHVIVVAQLGDRAAAPLAVPRLELRNQ
jgi:hypothetical protein